MDKISICNLAIGWCGGTLIVSLDDPSTEADLCKAAYDATRDLVLEQRDWTFAAARDTLVPLAEVPAFGYTRKFQLPSNLLVVRQVSDGPDMRAIDYVKEQRTILANTEKLYLKYTVKVTNESLFSPTFVYALAYKLASVIAIPLTGSQGLQRDMEGLAQLFLDSGGAIDGTQTKPGKASASRLLNSRIR